MSVTAELLAYVGQFLLAAGMLLVSLNAMRAGLLTRFLGILGVVSGVLFVFPQLMPLPVVQAFWLIALGLTLLGVGRTQLPPALADRQGRAVAERAAGRRPPPRGGGAAPGDPARAGARARARPRARVAPAPVVEEAQAQAAR